ncbi:hypothetical protein ABX050_001141 [Salmonella enterica]|nr:hypothetical protein [Salmonella enterica subsp. enterica serovar Ank]ECE3714669.1 hypothetical protein [Salmonella enterica]MJQ01255.1 hypothetical protein [Salmonella enterica subsp. enterica serovar Othmarschen]EBH2789573.1 hypothetical protein [Salmonella enterica subsp. enterica serovar Ank]EEI0869485.1 hypothetical protein [Salmonella enterica]
MPQVLFIGGPWNRTIREVNNSGDLIAEVNGEEVYYSRGEHQMPSGNKYLIALGPDAEIQGTPEAIRESGHTPFE